MTANARATFPAPATGTPPRSCGRIFTCGEAQIATLPFVYRSMGIFMPEKLGNLQGLLPRKMQSCEPSFIFGD